MIKWAEAKKAIRLTLGKELEKVGFLNPGQIMYRRREIFDDVVEFHFDNYKSVFIELGCHPKGLEIKNNFKTWDTVFKGRVHLANQVLVLELQETFDKQVEVIEKLSPVILNYINQWFDIFTNISSAIAALEDDEQVKNIIGAKTGSPYHTTALIKLQSLKENGVV